MHALAPLHRWSLLLAVATMVACTPKPNAAVQSAPAVDEGPGTLYTLPSGAYFRYADGWTVDGRDDGVVITGPDGQLVYDLVELSGVEPAEAIERAWASRRPDFDREAHSTLEQAAEEGWDRAIVVPYKTSPAENRNAVALAWVSGERVLIWLEDSPSDARQRRAAETRMILGSLAAPGYVEERYAGRDARTVDDAVLDEVRAYVHEAMEILDVPGVAVALFDDDEILMAEGFGVKAKGADDPVTADTKFLIASNTKALTTLLLAKLVDEGEFAWDTPVTEVYPDFELGDAETTAKVRIEHLVCACTGLPRQDFEWLFTFHESSPQAALEILGTMQPTTDFGELFQYSNPLASAAGYIGAHVVHPDMELGAAYDAAMREKVFAPLGMNATTFSFEEAVAGDHARPHSLAASRETELIQMGLNHSIVPVRPAGGAWSTVGDYARYLQLEMNAGRLADGTALVSEAAIRERWKPKVGISDDMSYGMGLIVRDHKGVQVVSHGGSMIGYKSQFFLVPELGIGGVVYTNADSGTALANNLGTRFLEVVYGDDTPQALDGVRSAASASEGYMEQEVADWQMPADPAHVGMLAQHYRSPDLGDVYVETAGGAATFTFGAWSTTLASKVNPDGGVSFMSADAGVLGFEFDAGQPDGAFETITLRDPQHTYVFEAVTGE